MARIDIDIEDYLDEVSTANLILELEGRNLKKDDIDLLRIIISNNGILEKLETIKPLSLIDALNLEEFLYTLNK